MHEGAKKTTAKKDDDNESLTLSAFKNMKEPTDTMVSEKQKQADTATPRPRKKIMRPTLSTPDHDESLSSTSFSISSLQQPAASTNKRPREETSSDSVVQPPPKKLKPAAAETTVAAKPAEKPVAAAPAKPAEKLPTPVKQQAPPAPVQQKLTVMAETEEDFETFLDTI